MLNCKYHPDQPAVSVFKAHAPAVAGYHDDDGTYHLKPEQYERNRQYAHSVNLFLCAACTGPFRDGRYAPVRTVKIQPETLPDNWELTWRLLYDVDGVYVFVDPRTPVYTVKFGQWL